MIDNSDKTTEIAVEVLQSHAKHLRDLAAVEENPFTKLGLEDASSRAEKAASWYAKSLPGGIPPEPPPGVYAGNGHDIWQREREDDTTTDDMWWLTGHNRHHTWSEAYEKGCNPRRRLLEFPEATEENRLKIENEIEAMKNRGEAHYEDAFWYLAAIRAVAERG